jgi:hypothetical protein
MTACSPHLLQETRPRRSGGGCRFFAGYPPRLLGDHERLSEEIPRWGFHQMEDGTPMGGSWALLGSEAMTATGGGSSQQRTWAARWPRFMVIVNVMRGGPVPGQARPSG